MLPQKRRRNYAQRSRTGCSTCRKRHVRCDEKKPACTNCLTGGRQCSYPDPFVTFGTSGPSSSEDEPSTIAPISAEQLVSEYQPSVTELLDLTPRKSFTGFSLELPPVSRRLFHYFAQQRTPRVNHGGWQESAVVHKALANPGYFHASLIMASIHSIWMGASFDEIKPALQYHRLEACRFVSQQLHDPKKAKSEATVATIATLALLEACFFDCIGFDLRLLDTHIDGMQRALNYKPGKLKDNPLQSLTRMVVREIKKGPVMVQWVAFSKKHLPVVEAISYPQPLNPKWLAYPDTQWRSQASGLEWRAELGHIGKPEGVRYFEVRSQVAFIMSSLYMFVQIPWNVLSSYVLNWVIELFFSIILKTEPGVFSNVSGYKSLDKRFGCGDSAAAPVPFDARNWFWMCIYCATAIESAIPRNKKEELQKELYMQVIYRNLRRVSDLLQLKDWEMATKVLQHVKWDGGFEGEARIRELWQKAALGQSPGNLSEETCFYEKKSSASI